MSIKHRTIVRPIAPSTTPTTPITAPPATPVELTPKAVPATPADRREDAGERTFGRLWDAGRITWHDDMPVVTLAG